ncbi:MAG: hypothetical protein KZQ71_16545, partial [Candidatus Thiodiazotropha sp. (ex Lucinoma aequizonata)]|nr:hypothetical protein [Candidatus Thiodiazotropha sp. (ex Lucinoma aequizonata)]
SVAIPAIQPRLRLSGTNRLRSAFHGGQRLKKVIHALESRKSKPRYHVTFPTHLFALLRHILRSRGMDRALKKVSGDGKR